MCVRDLQLLVTLSCVSLCLARLLGIIRSSRPHLTCNSVRTSQQAGPTNSKKSLRTFWASIAFTAYTDMEHKQKTNSTRGPAFHKTNSKTSSQQRSCLKKDLRCKTRRILASNEKKRPRFGGHTRTVASIAGRGGDGAKLGAHRIELGFDETLCLPRPCICINIRNFSTLGAGVAE